MNKVLIPCIFRYARKDALALGKLSLNLSHVPTPPNTESFNQSMYKLLESLVTKVYYLPMSLQNMNTWALIPKKDYLANRLVSGRLQLSAHTHLIIDETAMSEGKLNLVVKNLFSLFICFFCYRTTL